VHETGKYAEAILKKLLKKTRNVSIDLAKEKTNNTVDSKRRKRLLISRICIGLVE